jgi:hypothetical protein
MSLLCHVIFFNSDTIKLVLLIMELKMLCKNDSEFFNGKFEQLYFIFNGEHAILGFLGLKLMNSY